jgi:naphthalene 1,2-dioxygenase system ferredoxin subunit
MNEASQQWVKLCDVDDVPVDDVWAFNAAGHEFAVYGINGQVYATANECTHGMARLSEGFVEGGQIECPLHQGRFDICTGKALCAPLEQDLRTFPVQVRGSEVFVLL